jgi:hypothetical protein
VILLKKSVFNCLFVNAWVILGDLVNGHFGNMCINDRPYSYSYLAYYVPVSLQLTDKISQTQLERVIFITRCSFLRLHVSAFLP